MTSAFEPQQSEIVLFELYGTTFALPVEGVQEVLPMLEPIAVPGWPPEALGLMDVRGDLVPLLDIAPMLMGAALVLSPRQHVLLTSASDRRLGVVVDKVLGIASAPMLDRSSRAKLQVQVPEVCRGIARLESGPVIVIEPDELVSRVGVLA